jgi:P pilus assembly chaperone PapD
VIIARILWLCALLLPEAAIGQMITPMVYDLAPSGKQATRVLEFRNVQAKSLAVEVEATRRSYDQDGKPIDSIAGGAIDIMPMQFVVAPGVMQKVRVRYKGSESLTSSISFAVAFREVPLQQSPAAPQVRTLFDVRTLAHVVPSGAATDLRIQSIEYTGTVALITFANAGTRYGRLDGAPLRLSSGSQTVDFSPGELRDRLDLRWIDPGGRRIASIPFKRQAAGPITAEWLRGN